MLSSVERKIESVKRIEFDAIELIFYAFPGNNKMWCIFFRLEQPPKFHVQRFRREHCQTIIVLKDDTETPCHADFDLQHREFPVPGLKERCQQLVVAIGISVPIKIFGKWLLFVIFGRVVQILPSHSNSASL